MEAAESVDSLVTVDYNWRGVVSLLYGAARKTQAGPLCVLAADKFARARTLLFVTGFRTLRYGGVYETDGLVSTCLLSRQLAENGCEVAVVVDEGFEKVVKAGLKTDRVNVYGAPINREHCEAFTKSLLNNYNFDTAVFVERPGANRSGQYHNMHGENISALHAPLDTCIHMLRDKGISVVAFGDGGNEAGMGAIHDSVKDEVKFANVCRCGCGGGVVAATSADVLVVSSISDLGVYGATALYDPTTLNNMLEEVGGVMKALQGVGVVDVFKGPGYAGVDGLSLEGVRSVISMLIAITRSGVRTR